MSSQPDASPSPSARFWAAQAAVAGECLAHPFVAGLANGTLDQNLFRGYVAQDAFFLRAFARAYALLAARAEGEVELRGAHALLGGVLEELETHRVYAASLDIDLDGVTPSAATLAYTDFLEATAWRGPTGVVLAAMAPCMRLYAWLGQRIAARGAHDHAYSLWVNTYSADNFEALAAALESMLDAASAGAGEAAQAAYARAMALEYAFFDGCWRAADSALGAP